MMQVTLSNNLLRIHWIPYSPVVEAEIEKRLQAIPSAIAGNQLCTWYVHLDQLEAVQAAFPNASYAPAVWAAYPVDPLGKTPETSFTQGALWDTAAIAAREQRMEHVRGRGRKRYQKRKVKA